MSLDKNYRDYFIRNLHDALSGHTSNSVNEAVRYSEQSQVDNALPCAGYLFRVAHSSWRRRNA